MHCKGKPHVCLHTDQELFHFNKNTMKNVILPALVLSTLSSCTIHTGQLVDLNHEKMVEPSEKAFGYSSCTYILGIGGNKTNMLLNEAKDDLVMNHPLSESEYYANQNVNYSYSNFVIYGKSQVIVSADIVNDAEGEIALDTSFFQSGMELFDSKNEFIGRFTSQIDEENILVLVATKDYHEKLETMDINSVYTHHGSFGEYALKEKISYTTDFTGEGEIVAFGLNLCVILDDEKNKHRTAQYEELKKK